jgi:hypothetical protein
MTAIARRLILFGGAAALSGCAATSPDDCDPARRGLVRGLNCMATGGYIEHRQGVQAQRDAAWSHYQEVSAETARLEAKLADLRQEGAVLRGQLQVQEQERRRLEARLAIAATDGAAALSLMDEVLRWANDAQRLRDQALNLNPPDPATLPFPSTAPPGATQRQQALAAALAAKKAEIARQKALADQRIKVLADHRAKAGARIGTITGGLIAGKGVGEEIMGIMLRRAGLTAVDPEIGVVVIALELTELAWEVYKAVRDDQRFRQEQQP